MEDLKDMPKRKRAAELMAVGYNIPATDTYNMFGDAHSTNWAENYQFFMNQNNPANFERVWRQAYYLYGRIETIRHQPVSFDQVMDFTSSRSSGRSRSTPRRRTSTRCTSPPRRSARSAASRTRS